MNSKELPWQNMTWEDFEKEWAFKWVKAIGEFDHKNEILVERPKDGFQGATIITPFYFGNLDNERKLGIFVNWGWVSSEYWDRKIWKSNIDPVG